MSGVAVINSLLSNAAGVTALVPATKIFTGDVPQGVLPAVRVGMVSDVEAVDVQMELPRLVTERVQVTAYASSYAAKAAILDAARAACVGAKGRVNGIAVDSIMPGGTGPDIDDIDQPLFERSRDFMVTWVLAA